jgi:ArsR family transcriptional regulator
MEPSRIVDRSSAGAAGGYRALSDPTRLAILQALSGRTRCVCELGPQLGMAQNLLSYHLKILREAGLVVGRRSGRRIEYRIRADVLRGLRDGLDRLAGGEAA